MVWTSPIAPSIAPSPGKIIYSLDGWGWLIKQAKSLSDEVAIVGRAEEIRQARESGRVALVMTLENSDGLERSLHAVHALHGLGVRSITLTWSTRSWAGDGVEEGAASGMTAWGRSLVREMNDVGMLVDISHASERTFWDAVEMTTAPLLASHSSCHRLCSHPRNLKDEQLRALSEMGGVVGISWLPDFIHPTDPTVDLLIDHIEHAIEVAGIDHVGLGSDFDGGGTLLEDAGELPVITQKLLERGHSRSDIGKVLGENHLRLFEEVCG